jgi:hypothetical protein
LHQSVPDNRPAVLSAPHFPSFLLLSLRQSGDTVFVCDDEDWSDWSQNYGVRVSN